ncbi:MAG: hypothetical protein LIO81_11135 [Clostridiales bacterium]|nr:hypothetical protein [Clostridiales bacterium]
MKTELDYFHIGDAFGGSQDWFADWWMNKGGCAALAACDSCIQLQSSGLLGGLYPFDIHHLNKTDYIAFGMQMKPYLRPRVRGVNRLDIYIDGMRNYLKDIKNDSLALSAFSSDEPYEEACARMKRELTEGFPIPFLLLKHRSPALNEYLWHWFMLTGFQEWDGAVYVRATTYGSCEYLSFEELWNSGFPGNGGMILYHINR